MPDEEVNNAFLYCLIEAALMYGIKPLLSQMMSNHHHTDFFDPYGFVVEFTHRFHTHFSKWINAYRGRWENMWADEPPCLVELVSADDVVDKLVYTAINPVKADLVEKVHDWPGPDLVSALLDGRTLKARRPKVLFREDGPLPDEVEITLTIPTEVGDHDEIVSRVRSEIERLEQHFACKRALEQRRVLGRKRILRQSWRDSPTSHEPRRGLRPRVAARSKWARIEALQRNKAFRAEYRVARAGWLNKEVAVVFPEGTYWLRVFARVPTHGFYPPLPSRDAN